jgi:hypothetical protein
MMRWQPSRKRPAASPHRPSSSVERHAVPLQSPASSVVAGGAERRAVPLHRPASSVGECGAAPRTFRHITWREQGQQAGWIVQWQGKTHGGFHANQDDAAKTLKEVMALPPRAEVPRMRPASSVASGPRAASYATVASRHVGVYWHKQKGAYTTSSGGMFSTVGAAVRATGAERKKVKPSVLMQRVRCMRQVSANGALHHYTACMDTPQAVAWTLHTLWQCSAWW